MKKRVFIVLIIIIVLFFISVFIPVKEGKEWVNDDNIAEIGHYEKCYYNIYGGNITKFITSLKSK